MSRFFRWCMRNGAAFLFAFAVIQFVVGLVPLVFALITETGRMASNHGYSPGNADLPFGLQLNVLLSSMSSAAFPFFGALVIDRLDRWLALKEAREAVE